MHVLLSEMWTYLKMIHSFKQQDQNGCRYRLCYATNSSSASAASFSTDADSSDHLRPVSRLRCVKIGSPLTFAEFIEG